MGCEEVKRGVIRRGVRDAMELLDSRRDAAYGSGLDTLTHAIQYLMKELAGFATTTQAAAAQDPAPPSPPAI